MFYMHRRVYLADDKGQGGAHLRPPEFAMTRKQVGYNISLLFLKYTRFQSSIWFYVNQSKRFLRSTDSANSTKIKQINIQLTGLGAKKEDDAVKSRKQTQLKKTSSVKKNQVAYIQKYSSTKPGTLSVSV
jgi:hypothetical protein